METHKLVDDKKENIVLSLFRQVGSVHDNIAFVESTPSDLSINQNIRFSNNLNSQISKINLNRNNSQSISISFHELNYEIGHIKKRKIFSCCKLKPRKQILFNISGSFSTGMNAILGPSGSGKSSLLDILADRKDKNGLSGYVLVSGKPRSKIFKYSIGYVVQEDIINGTLSVRENLMFSANVRLSHSKTINERIELVNQIIHDLGLETCADTQIGTHFIRGVSGGEKKRVCIGMELVLSPTILFLDEPTSGLDASTAENVMKCLYNLSRRGCTIIFSIHQPRYSIFKLFDTILLLSSGRQVYLGPTTNILSYFASLGFKCEEHDNPADFLLDVIIQCNNYSSTLLENAYSKSIINSNYDKYKINENQYDNNIFDDIIYRSRINELYYVSIRTFRNTIRDPAIATSQIIVATLLALLTGLVFNRIEATIETGVQNRLGVIFFIIINQIYSTTTALEPLIQERALFIHNASGYYRVSTFFMAKLICDLLPMRFIPSIIFSVITYFMTGFQLSTNKFFIYLLTIFMTTVFGSAICFFVASFIPIFVVSLIVIVFIFVVMMVFSGFLIDLKSIFSFLQWIKWFSAFRYGTNLLTINEFRHLKFCLPNNTQICPLTGEQILIQHDIAYNTNWDMWKNLLALLIMIMVFLIMAFIQLLRMKKVK
ncbi:unnamed protein product [Rotaria sp. Silwood2]|nr:unnamed protein product [Rotaria sp. Silwood2]CAF2901849.1 unnamed protein product [Rotaria sp. Silwood2]CAF3064783.1 unnamed protein product [Rotaria sp. Silwood2]CAF4077854.1 unnamed protein product [Rotaria sp. Silwood2]